ncbi:thiamine pyrophosphate-dependent enzyme [Flavobacteriales bacterium]|nr:thiamine pyrophosphate-dependent enzyme [Flavobacteriales bacterium]
MKETVAEKNIVKKDIPKKILLEAYELMCTAISMTELYEENKAVTSKYVHATSRGHEAIQLAVSMQLKPCDYLTPYYRDDSMLLGIGMKPYDLMLQLLGKRDDPFSGGRTYYCHPSLKDDDKPKIPHQSSATGMQAIPAAGLAMGIQYLENQKINTTGDNEIVVCSLGDACITEGEVSEAFHMAALKQLPIIFLVQDNEWDISAHASEIRTGNAFDYAKGFPGLEAITIDGTDFINSYTVLEETINKVRTERRPFLIHAEVPLLNHHTSGVRMEWYRDDLKEQRKRDPFPKFKAQLKENGIGIADLINIEAKAKKTVEADYELALKQEDPRPEDLFDHDFAPTPITEEKGEREPKGKEATVMVDSALFAVQELMAKHPECLLYGQDVGGRLGGVFREAATLAQKFGDERVFNTPIQEAFIIGSTVGMSAVGTKPIVEVQFADYIWPGLNQLFSEVSRSCYLSNGKWPVSSILRVPIGAYGSGGPYHSSSVESVLSNIRGIKIAYPSTGADLKGLMKAAYYDPNPCIMLEHKGLYWSKIKGTEGAKTIEPDEDYIIPFGKGRVVLDANNEEIDNGNSLAIITYGMGVYWSTKAAKDYKGQVEIIDIRTIYPLDEELIIATAKKHGKCIVVTEEPSKNGFGQSIASLISTECFESLDAPVKVVGSENMPAIPLNSTLEHTMVPNSDKVSESIKAMLSY